MRNLVIWIAVVAGRGSRRGAGACPAGAAGRGAPDARRGPRPRARGQPSPGRGARAGSGRWPASPRARRRSGRPCRRRPATRAPTTCLEFVVPGPDRAAARDLPGRARQLPHAPRRAVADLHRRPHRRARAGGARRGGAATAETEIARADLRLEVSRAFWAVVTARAAVAVLEQALERAPSRTSATRARAWRPAWCRPTRWRRPRRRRRASACCWWRRATCATWRRPTWRGWWARRPGPGGRAARRAASDAAAPIALATCWPPKRAAQRAERKAHRAAHHRRRPAAQPPRRPRRRAGPRSPWAAGCDYARPNPRIFPRADRWDDSWDAGVSVSWSLWDGGRAAAEVAQARSRPRPRAQRLRDFDAGARRGGAPAVARDRVGRGRGGGRRRGRSARRPRRAASWASAIGPA